MTCNHFSVQHFRSVAKLEIACHLGDLDCIPVVSKAQLDNSITELQFCYSGWHLIQVSCLQVNAITFSLSGSLT